MPDAPQLRHPEVSGLLREFSEGFLGVTMVVRCEDWVPESSPGTEDSFFRSEGQVTIEEFGKESQLKFLAWLADAHWLDEWPPTSFPELELATALRAFGAITLTVQPPGNVRGYNVGPHFGAIAPDGREVSSMSVLVAARAAKAVEAGEVGPHYWVNATAFWMALFNLRQSLNLAVRRARGNDTWRQLVNHSPRFEFLRQIAEHKGGWGSIPHPDAELTALQFWFLSQVWDEGLEVVPVPDYPRMGLAFRPRNARQRIWVTLAATAGVIETPFEVEGLFQCDYGRCGRWFLSSNLNPKGENRFCSVRCGKNFHAAAATRRRRAAKKERGSGNG